MNFIVKKNLVLNLSVEFAGGGGGGGQFSPILTLTG